MLIRNKDFKSTITMELANTLKFGSNSNSQGSLMMEAIGPTEILLLI
jgi:hypothetical protein